MIFPNYFRIDYVRVYQNSDGTIGCDPDGEWTSCLFSISELRLKTDHPTAAYIEQYAEVYNNPNITTWAGAGESHIAFGPITKLISQDTRSQRTNLQGVSRSASRLQ